MTEQDSRSPVAGADAGEQESADLRPAARGISRRGMVAGTVGAAAMLGLGGLKLVGSDPVCRPPGGQDENRLIGACIRCERCYEACPRDVIVPGRIEDGVLSMRTPTLNFDANYCDFCAESNNGVPRCIQVCPTQALLLPEGVEPESAVLGIAVVDSYQCLAFRDSGCKYCYDACEYEAIEMIDGKPQVIADKCNGCGACESVCVSLKAGSIAAGATERAIVVRPAQPQNA